DGKIKIDVDDDSPKGTFTVSSQQIIHDETPGDDADAHDFDADLSSLFTAVTNKGSDPHVTPADNTDPIGYAQSAGAIITFNGGFGADGGTKTYSIEIPGAATSKETGLKTTEGKSIALFEVAGNPNLLVGRYDADNNGLSANDKAAFAIHIDPATGVLTLVQY